jgi:hypothetical protein
MLNEAEGVGEVLECGWMAGFEVDGENVEADGDVAVGELTQVMAGETAEDSALVAIDGDVRFGNCMGGAGFDFDEAEGVAAWIRMPGDEVEVAAGA